MKKTDRQNLVKDTESYKMLETYSLQQWLSNCAPQKTSAQWTASRGDAQNSIMKRVNFKACNK